MQVHPQLELVLKHLQQPSVCGESQRAHQHSQLAHASAEPLGAAWGGACGVVRTASLTHSLSPQ